MKKNSRSRRFLRRAAPFLLLCGFAAFLITPASAFLFKKSAAEAPVSSFAKNVLVGEAVSFDAGDFAASPALDSIIITQLPASGTGILKFGSQDVQTGAVVAMDAVEGLKFYPADAAKASSASFAFLPVTNGVTGNTPVTVSIHVLSKENTPPIAKNLDLKTYKNVAVTSEFQAVDTDGDAITFQIIKKPARGELILATDGTASFVYKPYDNKTGKDSFSYTATDAVGNVSDAATVTVKIEKSGTSVTYSDMEDNAAYCAALQLAEKNIFVGESLGSEHFFNPEAAVSRSEFVAMALTAAGVTQLSDAGMTGFSDDASIPSWAKPYVTTALKAGVIKGVSSSDGQIAFQANAPITFAEAAVILNRAMSFTDVSAAAAYTDAGSIPAWASQAAVNLETRGVLSTNGKGALNLSRQVTRADAAELLAAALDVAEAQETSSGLFSWFGR